MSHHEIKAYFVNAQDARRALNLLEAMSLTVQGPEPLQRPVNGRTWAIDVVLGDAAGTTDRYVSETLVGQVTDAVLRYGGTLQEPVS